MTKKKSDQIIGEYQYGFNTDIESVIEFKHGLSKELIENISKYKQEPMWMAKVRQQSLVDFFATKDPHFGPDLSFIDYDSFKYFAKASEKVVSSWVDVPQKIKDTFERLGIPEAERKFLAGISTQFESEVVYHHNQKELDEKGVIFLDTDTALKEHPKLFKKYFGSVVKSDDNKFSALNTAVWSGGTFIYVPKGVTLSKPLQSYFRINQDRMGQFERTLIIVDEGASLNYVEGCTAPIYTNDSLHAAVVEIVVKKNATCRYTTIQNWSTNVLNLVTKRAHIYQNGHMEWVDGNIGSRVNMKYPSCILLEPFAKGSMISIAFAGINQIQDAGSKMIHLAPNTTSNIISKSIARQGGKVNYRGKVYIDKNAKGAKSNIECDTILLDDLSTSDTIPFNIVKNADVIIQHEAKVSKVSEEQLFYLQSRGLSTEQATEMIVMGFIEPFSKELPMEYAIELNQLIKLEMEGSIG